MRPVLVSIWTKLSMRHNHYVCHMLIPILALTLLALQFPVVGQTYITRQYTATSDRDIPYTVAPAFNGRMDTMKLNVWYPMDDNAERRPLVVWVHGGGFSAGNRAEMNAVCERWASRGYVAATISYRLSFYGPWPFDPPFAYDTAEVVRACYRGVQDLRSALSYLSSNAARYKIDTSRTILGGVSAGAIIALHGAFVDASDIRPPALSQIAPVTRAFEQFLRPDLGSMNGWQSTNVPLPQIRAVINIFGGLLDPRSIDGAPFVPTYSYHQKADPVVACGTAKGLWGLPLDVSANYPKIHGSCTLTEEFVKRGIDTRLYETWIYNGTEHAIHNEMLVDSLAAVFCVRHIEAVVSVDETSFVPDESGLHTILDLRGSVCAITTSTLSGIHLPDGIYTAVSARHAFLFRIVNGVVIR